MNFTDELSLYSQKFCIYRNNQFIAEVKGLYRTEDITGKKYVAFPVITDIQTNDFMISLLSLEKHKVVAVQFELHNTINNHIKAYYLFDYEINQTPSVVAVNNSDIIVNRTYNTQNNSTVNNQITNNYVQNFINEITDIANKSEDIQPIIDALNEIKSAIENQTTPPESTWSKLGAASAILSAAISFFQGLSM